MVLDRPEIPRHTNRSENDIRCYVTRRKISAGTRSDIGRDCRDAFLSLAKTCDKLGIAVGLSGQQAQGRGARTHRAARPLCQGKDPARLIRGGADACAPLTARLRQNDRCSDAVRDTA